MARHVFAALAVVAVITGLAAGPVAAKPAPPPAPGVTVSATVSGTRATISASVNRFALLVRSCTYTLDSGNGTPCGRPDGLKLTSTGWTIKLARLSDGSHAVTVAVKLWIGGTVAGSTTFTIGHKVFAVAFTNVDATPGYQPANGDVLIAELIDTNDSLAIDAGDTIVMGKYPTTFAGPYVFDNFSVTSHTVAQLNSASSTQISVVSGGNDFLFQTGAVDIYRETNESSPYPRTSIEDEIGAQLSDDIIATDPNSPSGPATTISSSQFSDPDDSFIDVLITL